MHRILETAVGVLAPAVCQLGNHTFERLRAVQARQYPGDHNAVEDLDFGPQAHGEGNLGRRRAGLAAHRVNKTALVIGHHRKARVAAVIGKAEAEPRKPYLVGGKLVWVGSYIRCRIVEDLQRRKRSGVGAGDIELAELSDRGRAKPKRLVAPTVKRQSHHLPVDLDRFVWLLPFNCHILSCFVVKPLFLLDHESVHFTSFDAEFFPALQSEFDGD